ncbi:MAG: DNA-3-methyladenine glycosylase I [Chloroflexota bacterium]
MAASVANAQGVLALYDAGTTLADHLWSFVDGKPVINWFAAIGEIPAETSTSKAMSKDLLRRGFKFVGPTILYALMQSAGLVNDHEVSCFRWSEVQQPG